MERIEINGLNLIKYGFPVIEEGIVKLYAYDTERNAYVLIWPLDKPFHEHHVAIVRLN